LILINVEKHRFSVFSLSCKGKLTASVQVHHPEVVALHLWISCLDSEYGLLLPMQITDSYMLNAAANEDPTSQNSRVRKGGTIR